jgi:hypothetical protein
VLCVQAFAYPQKRNLYTTCCSMKAVTSSESLLFNKRSSSERQFSLLAIQLSSAVVRKRSDTWHHVSRCFYQHRRLALASKSVSYFALNSISYCWYLMKCFGRKKNSCGTSTMICFLLRMCNRLNIPFTIIFFHQP